MKTKYRIIIFQSFLFLFSTQLYAQWERLADIKAIRSDDQIQKEHTALLLNSTSIDSFITATMAIYHIPGLSACIIKDDSLVWHQAYGYADVERKVPVTDSTLFFLASISKTITGTALMQLYERGLFKLDDNVNNYLPAELQVINPSYPKNSHNF
jgi:CubicO group peptidase (beta-lactamase class C family)